ncbi:hypothetical protein [Fischerella sp.]|uniref:hypothetical protein n=1 Tax=Fischerella sp. TaxID=1191 RepID=UPI0025BDF07D|nr:hypothetical protein [Fischerella sp.]
MILFYPTHIYGRLHRLLLLLLFEDFERWDDSEGDRILPISGTVGSCQIAFLFAC